jgi:hypothetical protein
MSNKIYATLAAATAIATKFAKKDGIEYAVTEMADGFHVHPASETPVQEKAAPVVEASHTPGETVVTETAKAPKAPAAKKQPKPVTITVPNCRETAKYLISEPFMGKPRWFEKARLDSYELNDGTATITMTDNYVRNRDKMKELLSA